MNKIKILAVWCMLLLLSVSACGCALIGTAASAAVGYAIYTATRK